jgi:hypothetical protein
LWLIFCSASAAKRSLDLLKGSTEMPRINRYGAFFLSVRQCLFAWANVEQVKKNSS